MSDPTADRPVTDPSPTDLNGADDDDLERKQGLLDRFRGTGVGVEDPNIVGDPDPVDVAPGEADADPSGPPPRPDPGTAPPGG